MKLSKTYQPLILFVLALLLAVPALLINLGSQPVIDDEAIRALVAVEMIENGEYITPTIAGELYLKKPPLYNWLILISYKLMGSYDEWAVRMPMVVSLLVFTVLIFYYFRKELDARVAVLAALMFLTSGRILIYESLHGLIDITYSLIIFLFFMHIYRSFMQGKMVWLYLGGYLLIALAFLMKGLPSIVFLGITLLVLFISNRKFKLLFHWGHYLGVILFAAIVGGYYYLYFRNNGLPLQEILDVILGESTRRTVIRFGFWQTVLHILVYPFEVLYHFLPWSLLLILFFARGSFRLIRKQPFIRYISLVFLANIVIYWTSPEVFPRYILMLIPLMFGVFAFLFVKQREQSATISRVIEIVFGVLLCLLIPVGLAPVFAEVPLSELQRYIYSGFLLTSFGLLTYLYWAKKQQRLILVVMALLIARIGFDLIVIPTRVANSEEIDGKEMAKFLADESAGETLEFWHNPEVDPDPYYGYRVSSYRFNYYLVLNRKEVVNVTLSGDTTGLYIGKKGLLWGEEFEILQTFRPPGSPSDLVLFRILPRKQH